MTPITAVLRPRRPFPRAGVSRRVPQADLLHLGHRVPRADLRTGPGHFSLIVVHCSLQRCMTYSEIILD